MLKLLYDLQAVESRKREIEAELDHSADRLKLHSLKQAFVETEAQYREQQETIAALEQESVELSGQLEEAQQKLIQEQEAIYDGSTNSLKALAAREEQTAALQEKIESFTARQAEIAADLEQRKELLTQEQAEMAEQYAQFKVAKAACLAAAQEQEQHIAALDEQLAALTEKTDAQDLDWYHAMQRRVGFTPIAVLDHNHICSGCHVMVTPAVYHRAAQGQTVECENCGRMLFLAGE